MNSLSLRRSALAAIAGLALLPLAACGGDDDAPKIPHAITSTDDTYCLGCHKDGANGAPKAPHPDRNGCTGCHSK